MNAGVQLGGLLLSLGLTTAVILFIRVNLSPRAFLSSLSRWSWDNWSFDSQWLSQNQLAAFTLVYSSIGVALVLETPLWLLAGLTITTTFGLTIADRSVADRARRAGIPDHETQNLSRWRWFTSKRAHSFTRGVDDGDIHWVPSTLTVFSLPLFFTAIGLGWLILGTVYPESAWVFKLATALTVGVPALMVCMLGPTPAIVKR